MYASSSDRHSSIERLYSRQQQPTENYEKFALELDLLYLKVHAGQNIDQNSLITFIAERSLPDIRPHLLGCNATALYDSIHYASKI